MEKPAENVALPYFLAAMKTTSARLRREISPLAKYRRSSTARPDCPALRAGRRSPTALRGGGARAPHPGSWHSRCRIVDQRLGLAERGLWSGDLLTRASRIAARQAEGGVAGRRWAGAVLPAHGRARIRPTVRKSSPAASGQDTTLLGAGRDQITSALTRKTRTCSTPTDPVSVRRAGPVPNHSVASRLTNRRYNRELLLDAQKHAGRSISRYGEDDWISGNLIC
jgi:hypothetical protein